MFAHEKEYPRILLNYMRSGGEFRIRELIEEEKAYCDKGNYKHMAQILTSVALYEVLQKHGKSEDEAYRVVSEEMWKFLDPSGMQKLAKLEKSKRQALPVVLRLPQIAFDKTNL